jgi:hypothetical protein
MVVLDCTGIRGRVREDLFMPSRDRLRNCHEKQAFETALERYLHEHEELDRLNRQRREDQLRGRLADDRPLSEALKNVIDSSPELRSLFRLGSRIPALGAPGDRPQPFVGVRFPTFFRPQQQLEPGRLVEIKCPLGDAARVRFVTDAENDYFTRAIHPGEIAVSPPELFARIHLHDGRALLVLNCPEESPVGTAVDITVEITDPSRTAPFKHELRIEITEPHEPCEREHDDPRPRSGSLSLPKIVEVTQEQWEQEEFGPESGLAIHNDIDGGLVAMVNIDNEHLRRMLERTSDGDRDLVRKQFTYGLVLAGVSLWQEYSDHEDCDEIVRTTTKAIARVLLPTITVLGRLEQDILELA